MRITIADALGSSQTNIILNSLLNLPTIRLMKPWSLSNNGITYLATLGSGVVNGFYIEKRNKLKIKHPVQDGFILEIYLDSKGLPTVGLGHLVVPEDNLKVDQQITIEQAKKFVLADLKTAIDAIHRNTKAPLMQYEFAVLISLCFNSGQGAFARILSPQVNTGDDVKTAELIKTYRSKGNEWKRNLESTTFSTGVYNAQH